MNGKNNISWIDFIRRANRFEREVKAVKTETAESNNEEKNPTD